MGEADSGFKPNVLCLAANWLEIQRTGVRILPRSMDSIQPSALSDQLVAGLFKASAQLEAARRALFRYR